MLELLKRNHYEKLMDLTSSSTQSIECVSPYVKTDATKSLLSYKKAATKLSLVTNPSLRNIMSQSLDTEALSTWLGENGRLFGYATLHAKIYLFDRKYGIVTSANLTNGGLHSNLEYGVLFNDQQLIAKLVNDIEAIYHDPLTNEIKQEWLSELMKFQQTLKPTYLTTVVSEDSPTNLLMKEEAIRTQLKGWKKEIFELIKVQDDEFTLADVYQYKSQMQILHPKNQHIEEKMRQVLQNLRDLGIIEFVGKGIYRKSY